MHKILLVARRDYLASVRSKPFLFGLILAPILGCSGFLVVGLMKVKPDLQPRRDRHRRPHRRGRRGHRGSGHREKRQGAVRQEDRDTS